MDVSESEVEIHHGADGHRDCTGQAGTRDTQCRRAKVTEDQHVIENDVCHMHEDQRRHVQA